MAERKEDDIMAEYLLKGGKMLEKTCRTCGCPQFEYKGKTFCVVCAERSQEKQGKAPSSGGKAKAGQAAAARPAMPAAGGQEMQEAVILDNEIAAAVLDLTRRIRTEEDPDRCLVLMDAVKIGAEALQVLRQM